MCEDNRYPFIENLHNVLLAPDLCDRLLSIIKLMNSGYICLLHEGFFTLYFMQKEKNVVTLSHSAQRKHVFLVKIKEMPKTKKLPSRKKISLELMHQRLGHRSTRSLLAGDTANVWEDIKLRIYPDPFCISCQIFQ